MRRIWLIGGTQESAQLAQAIVTAQWPCTISVTTAAAQSLYPKGATLRVWIGQLLAEQLPLFLQEQAIAAILDASHPYATTISQLAIAASAQYSIPYLRYERLNLSATSSQIEYFDSFPTLLASNRLVGQRVLLTVGYRPLTLFQAWQDQATLFARILPSEVALQAALQAGFTRDRLIALRPPVSLELERALWQQWQISLVVTKASGTASGEDVKHQVATELGIPLLIVQRPQLAYPQVTQNQQAALAFCQQHLTARLDNGPAHYSPVMDSPSTQTLGQTPAGVNSASDST